MQIVLAWGLSQGRPRWYDFVFLLLASTIIYPDSVVRWVGDRANRVFGMGLALLVETIAIGVLTLFTQALQTSNSPVRWWDAALPVGVVGLIRILVAIVNDFFGFNR